MQKIKALFWRIVLTYHEYKNKKFERHNCYYCGNRYLFDVPIDTPIDQIIFVCNKCTEAHRQQEANDFINQLNSQNEEIGNRENEKG